MATNRESFEQALETVVREDPRYPAEAYVFVCEALDFTMRQLAKPAAGPARHVTGQELLEGIRQYALREFGPAAGLVMNHWRLTRCEDFGELVFNLVDRGLLGKTEQDRREDFAGGYDFDAAFRQPFRPAAARAVPPRVQPPKEKTP